MNRSKDLDTIAPDNLIVENENKPLPVIKSSPKKKKEVTKKCPRSREKIYDILGHSKNCLSSFLVNPQIFDFPEREKDEEIFLTLRSCWLINLKWIFFTFIMVFTPLLLRFVDFFSLIPIKYQIISIIFWYILTFIYAFGKFLNWYFDVFIITDRRLVDIKFNNLLNKHFAEVDLDRIQDVSSSVKGILGTFFNFGNILVQTASEINQITFRDVPNPGKIIKLFQELCPDNIKLKSGDIK
jgi:hypothetical protein